MIKEKSTTKRILLVCLSFYQKFLSPSLGQNCRFYPSCSSYSAQAIEKYGALKGLQKGFYRILKCNPYNKGGVNLP